MQEKTKSILGWSISGLTALMLAASAADKISGSAHSVEMLTTFGLPPFGYRVLGVIELISALLFLYPRTGVLGLVLLSSYFGGAIATHLQHNLDISFPMAIEAAVWIAAALRFPELSERIVGSKTRSV